MSKPALTLTLAGVGAVKEHTQRHSGRKGVSCTAPVLRWGTGAWWAPAGPRRRWQWAWRVCSSCREPWTEDPGPCGACQADGPQEGAFLVGYRGRWRFITTPVPGHTTRSVPVPLNKLGFSQGDKLQRGLTWWHAWHHRWHSRPWWHHSTHWHHAFHKEMLG